MVHEVDRIDDVADRLRHLLALVEQEAVGKDALGQREPGGHQEGRPVDGMEADDVLADDMGVGRPVLGAGPVRVGEVAGRGDIVRQRVHPDIHHMGGIVRDLDPPVERGARDRQVLQSRLDEGDYLVAPFRRTDEIGIVGVMLEQLFLIGRQLEEIALLLDPFDRRALWAVAYAIVAEFGLGLLVIGLVPDRIPPGVAALVDVAVIGHPVPNLPAGFVVARLGGADEIVVGSVKKLSHLAEFVGIPLCQHGRLNAFGARRLLHLLPVLVRTREEEDILSVEALETRHRVGRDQFIGMADMRLAVRIGNRGRDVVGNLVRHHSTRALEVVWLLAYVWQRRNP